MRTWLTADNVLSHTAQMFGTTVAQVCSPTRQEPTMTARHICAYLMRRHLPRLTFKRIATLLGRKDHAAAINSVRMIENAIATGDEAVICAVRQLEKELGVHAEYEREMDEVAARVAKKALA